MSAVLQMVQIGGNTTANAVPNMQNGVRLTFQIVRYRIGVLLYC